jgi:hypothetical protein
MTGLVFSTITTDAAREPWPGRCTFVAASWPMSCGLQAEAGDIALRWNASADLTGWLVLHFTFESAKGKR